ncbi:30S ribosomal protein S4 [bacterium]|nr:30S ribosomal protein S4 [candidate division CSSED10-310 bacterium]
MARYTESACRLCRREGEKLYLKGNRCFSEKCGFDRRSYAPGQHGQKRPRVTNFGIQLREKQKVKRMYGLMEKQFRLLFERAERMKGITGHNFMMLLEMRLDNVVYRASFALSRKQARQLVSHGHILVNGRRLDIPSFIVNTGDVIEIKEKSREMVPVKEAVEAGREIPDWLRVDNEKLKAEVVSQPTRESITHPIQEQLIVEFFSR